MALKIKSTNNPQTFDQSNRAFTFQSLLERKQIDKHPTYLSPNTVTLDTKTERKNRGIIERETMANEGTSPKIPTIQLSHGGVSMPVLGLGMAPNPPVPDEVTKNAVIDAVEVGYRHFDTATIYFTEKALGEGINQVLDCGMIKSREELFITSKLWVSDAHPNLVLPALKTTLK